MSEPSQQTDFKDTPSGWAQRWLMEMDTARKSLEKWREQGRRIVKRFLDEREVQHDGNTRWNLFHANVETQLASLYGQTPKVSVSRRYADANDDVARVAAEMLERLLNSDIEKDSDTFAEAMEYCLQDWLLSGFGLARIRYVAEFETVPETPAQVDPVTQVVLAPSIPATEKKTYECVETDYCHWEDVLWSPARVWHEVRWISFRAEMLEPAFNERFDPDGKKGLFAKMPHVGKSKERSDAETCNPWDRVAIHEIWDKETRQVFWVVEGYGETLDKKPDPYGLKGFFPCPRPLIANATTTKLIPRPDFVIAQDQYNEIDLLSTRITLLEQAIRVAGLYDKSNPSIQRLLGEAAQNELIPVDNWAMHGEKGGIRGSIDFLPLEEIVGAVTALDGRRERLAEMLYQVTGMADIMRGASDPAETARAQGIKARFGSVRLQKRQDRLAEFASDVQKLKSEVISSHFDVPSILEQSNAQYSFDMQVAPEAAQLLKSQFAQYRVEVKPESVSLQDFAALKNERMEVLTGVAGFVQAMGPLVQMVPGSAPFMLKILQWSISGLKGSSQIEGVLDKAIQQAEQAQKKSEAESAANAGKPPEPDPKVLLQQQKGQQELVKVQAELQADLTRTAAEVQANEQKERQQAEWNVREAQAKHLVTAANQPMGPGLPGGTT